MSLVTLLILLGGVLIGSMFHPIAAWRRWSNKKRALVATPLIGLVLASGAAAYLLLEGSGSADSGPVALGTNTQSQVTLPMKVIAKDPPLIPSSAVVTSPMQAANNDGTPDYDGFVVAVANNTPNPVHLTSVDVQHAITGTQSGCDLSKFIWDDTYGNSVQLDLSNIKSWFDSGASNPNNLPVDTAVVAATTDTTWIPQGVAMPSGPGGLQVMRLPGTISPGTSEIIDVGAFAWVDDPSADQSNCLGASFDVTANLS